MRILLDECVPRRFRYELPEHEVRTVAELGWASFKNGALLAAASGMFELLITTDQRLSYQQQVSGFELAVVVLVARRNKLEHLLPLVPDSVKSSSKSGPARFVAWVLDRAALCGF